MRLKLLSSMAPREVLAAGIAQNKVLQLQAFAHIDLRVFRPKIAVVFKISLDE